MPSSNNEVLKVYFKGLVSDETVMNVKMSFAGIGVAICDTSDHCVFELRKSFLLDAGDRGIECHVVELKALIHGLNVASVTLGSKRVQIFCDTNLVYQYVRLFNRHCFYLEMYLTLLRILLYCMYPNLKHVHCMFLTLKYGYRTYSDIRDIHINCHMLCHVTCL